MGETLAQVEELISTGRLVCGDGHVINTYMTDSDGELACPTCGYQMIDIPVPAPTEVTPLNARAAWVKIVADNRHDVDASRRINDITHDVKVPVGTDNFYRACVTMWHADTPVALEATPAQLSLNLIDAPKPYCPNLRKSAQAFRLSANAEINGWRGKVRNASHDHTISDYGPGVRCCNRATVIGRHMHLSSQATVIADRARYGQTKAGERLNVTIGQVITVDGADWRITNLDSLDDPYLMPA